MHETRMIFCSLKAMYLPQLPTRAKQREFCGRPHWGFGLICLGLGGECREWTLHHRRVCKRLLSYL